MAVRHPLSARLAWTLNWQSIHLMPLLRSDNAERGLLEFWTQQRRLLEVLAIAELSEASLSLDIGGGLTTPLRWAAGRRICIDPLADDYAARFPIPTERVAYVAGSGESLPWPENTFDFAVCTNCIDHTESPQQVMHEILRVLKPGGRFLFTCEEHASGTERNEGHPHALTRPLIVALTQGFETELTWENAWLSIHNHFKRLPPEATSELGFLLRKPHA